MESLVLESAKGQPVTTSMKVAAAFNKRHDDVLKAIQNLECTSDFNLRNFSEISYSDSMNRMQRGYEISKDGFAFLAMGFRGKKAATFKEKFINEFNKREAIIKNAIPQSPKTPAQITLMIAEQLVLQEEKILALEEKVNEVVAKQKDGFDDYYTVIGFATKCKKPITREKAIVISKKCGSLCDQMRYERKQMPDPRFGNVWAYPETVLKTVFNQFYFTPGF